MHVAVPHLARRNGVYYFRQSVPEDLRPRMRRRELKRSLGTGSLTLATALCKDLSSSFSEVFEELRMSPPSDDPAAESEIIQKLVDRVYRDRLDDHYLQQFYLTEEETRQNRESHLRRATALQKHLATNAVGKMFDEGEMIDLLKEFGLAEDLRYTSFDSPTFYRLIRELTRAEIRAHKTIADELTLPEDRHEAVPISGQLIPQQPGQVAPPVRTIGELQARYIEDKTIGGSWQPKTRQRVESLFALLNEVYDKDADIRLFDFDRLSDFRNNVLLKLPANRDKRQEYRDKSVAQILAMKSVKPMSVSNVRLYLTWLSSFFKWCYRRDFIDKNPAEGLNLPKPKGRPKKKRFSPDQLEILLSALCDQYRKKPSFDERYWVPLIALFSGARLDEVCQLKLDDIEDVKGILCLQIRAEGSDTHVKTEASIRTVPVHPQLTRLGFREYVRWLKSLKEKQLFPRLKKGRDGYGRKVGDWFAGFNDRVVSDDPLLTFHSFRHTFVDALKQQGEAAHTIAEIVGHENDDITMDRYGKRLQPDKLLAVMESLDLEVDLEAIDWPDPAVYARRKRAK